MTKYKKTNIKRSIKVFSISFGGSYIKTVTRTIYVTRRGKEFVKYGGAYYQVKRTMFMEGIRYNIWVYE